MEEKIKTIFKKVLKTHYIQQSKVGLWIMDGECQNSFVGVSEEDPIDYQIFFYCPTGKEFEEKEWLILFHEIAHVIIYEKIILEKGMRVAREEITKYEKEVERINTLSENEKQKEYKKIEMEKQADELGNKLYLQLKEEGLL